MQLVCDGGVENFNAAVDAVVEQFDWTRIRALVDVTFSNSKIEAWWRSLKHQWLYLNQLYPFTRRVESAGFGVRRVAHEECRYSNHPGRACNRDRIADRVVHGRRSRRGTAGRDSWTCPTATPRARACGA